MYICMYICMYIRIYMCIYMYIYICIYIYIIYTWFEIRSRSNMCAYFCECEKFSKVRAEYPSHV